MPVSSQLGRGILNLPGVTPQSRDCVKDLLAADAQAHHCFWGRAGFHNHLPHFLLATYDLGAPPSVLKAIYEKDAKSLKPVEIDGSKDIAINDNSWKTHLGDEKAYAGYLKFFSDKVEQHGPTDTIRKYVFSPDANDAGTHMLVRLVSGAAHPMIQVGYGIEFSHDLLVASGLAQTAVHWNRDTSLYQETTAETNGHSKEDSGPSLLGILRQFYDSETLAPVMPYDPDAFISKRWTDAFGDGTRTHEIVRIASQWRLPASAPHEFWERKVEEIIWTVVLLLFATGKPGRAPRLDFFVMHMVTSALFLPSFLEKVLSSPDDGVNRARLLQAYVRTCLAFLVIRGRPRIDATGIMKATPYPRPPIASTGAPRPNAASIGDPAVPEDTNPWAAIAASVIHAPEAHLPKTIRTLIYAAQRYALRGVGQVPGAFDGDGREILPGLGQVDGSLFVRCAGVAMDTLGWVDHGQAEGEWDRSALGWEDAWKVE
ncbi:hypothetical protein AURDEDRAFT_65498 [Auricularia subglabra TFB-10046 SS5]|nr:hypothetical protein AURDEDRAFT_65498 [Auricularia subglabra TFB-10046 SS5]